MPRRHPSAEDELPNRRGGRLSRLGRVDDVRVKTVAWATARRNASQRGQALDPLDFFGLQAEIEDFEIGPHVVGVGGPGQGHHADVEGEPEDDLADGPAVAFGDPGQFGAGQRLAVGGQQREALVDQPVGGAELAGRDGPSPGRRSSGSGRSGAGRAPAGTGAGAVRG